MSSHSHQHDNVKLTRNQELVWDVLQTANAPLSAYAILEQLKPEGLRAPLQVYRALEKLIQHGIVHRLESLNAFVSCTSDQCVQHAVSTFSICEKCGTVSEFEDDKLGGLLEELATKNGFQLSHGAIELKGQCKTCP